MAKTIFIDIGHGGKDPGAVSKWGKEKDENLKLGLDVKREIERHGVKVILSRESDKYLSLGERTTMANRIKADAFFSIHFNSFSNKEAKGTETFHHYDSENGMKLASEVQGELVRKKILLSNRGVKSAGFYVLRKSSMRASLIEVAFISNEEDMKNYRKNYRSFVEGISKALLKDVGVNYKAKEEKPVETEPKPIEVPKGTDIMLLNEPVTVPGEILHDKTYVSIDKAYADSTMINRDGSPVVQENIYLGLVEIFRACSLDTHYDPKEKVIWAGLSRDLKPEEDYIEVNLLGNLVRIKTKLVKGRHYILVGNYGIQMRGFFEKLGLKVTWYKDKPIEISK